jgi:predicted porin
LEKFAMKKTLIALAVIAASGAAFAQSSVTLFGGADLNYRSVKTGDNKFSGMAQDGIYSSRLGFRGVEDLGGGLKGNFHFEGGMAPDVGTSGGFNFTRKSTIGLAGGFGEVRLGRDYTPLFTIAGIADPFGTNGVGSSYNVANSVTFAGATAAADATTFLKTTTGSTTTSTLADPNAVRADNSIAYYSPSFSGFTADLMYSFGSENLTNLASKKQGQMTSLKLAYANGPLTAAFGNQVTNGGSTVAATLSDNQKWTTNFLAAAYDFGMAKVSAGYKTDKLSIIDETLKSMIVGVSAPLGATTLKASYVDRKAGSDKLANQFALGAVYDLSKRTSAYATYSALTNEAGAGQSVGSALASDFTGVKSKGFEVGVKHNF